MKCALQGVTAIFIMIAIVISLVAFLNSCSRHTIIVTSGNTPNKYITNTCGIWCRNGLLTSDKTGLSVIGSDGKAITCKFSGE